MLLHLASSLYLHLLLVTILEFLFNDDNSIHFAKFEINNLLFKMVNIHLDISMLIFVRQSYKFAHGAKTDDITKLVYHPRLMIDGRRRVSFLNLQTSLIHDHEYLIINVRIYSND